jgi:hypothetical protein
MYSSFVVVTSFNNVKKTDVFVVCYKKRKKNKINGTRIEADAELNCFSQMNTKKVPRNSIGFHH